jgi:transposase
MLTPGPTQQIYLSTELVDMRGGFDRLAARVIQAGFDLYAGHLFVFLSRRRTHLKVLTWDGSGMVILYKRLSKGRFPAVEAATNGACSIPLQAADLAVLLDGLAVSGVRRSKPPTAAVAPIDAAAGT